MRTSTKLIAPVVGLAWMLAVGCGNDDDINSDTEARWAYVGFDSAIDRALNLGFDGFNAANSANIPNQDDIGDEQGTMDVGGQVDQGASANKEMRLDVTLVEYSDGEVVDPEDPDVKILAIYDTVESEFLTIDLSLRNIPDGTFTGTVLGTLIVTGKNLDATADFDIALSGQIQQVAGGETGEIERTPGTLSITGTVSSGDGIYNVNTTL